MGHFESGRRDSAKHNPRVTAHVAGGLFTDTTAGQGRWANGPSLDGKGRYSYIAEPFAKTGDTTTRSSYRTKRSLTDAVSPA